MAESVNGRVRVLRRVAAGALLMLRASLRTVRLRIRHPLPIVTEGGNCISVLRHGAAGAGVNIVSVFRAGGSHRAGKLEIMALRVNGDGRSGQLNSADGTVHDAVVAAVLRAGRVDVVLNNRSR